MSENLPPHAGDLAIVVSHLTEYLKGKGQIWSAPQVASILFLEELVERRHGIRLGLDRFVKAWLELSEIEAHRHLTVAQKNVELVSRLGMQVNYVQEQGKETKYLPLVKRKK